MLVSKKFCFLVLRKILSGQDGFVMDQIGNVDGFYYMKMEILSNKLTDISIVICTNFKGPLKNNFKPK